MAFTFTNYAGIKPQQSPLHDLIGNLLGGYTEASNARYLQPNLQEALTKSKLANKWYEPNMQSQIGLRGAQAGHLGAMTQGLNISNPFLKHKLEQEEAQRQFGIDNPLLSKTGAAGQIGALMYLQQHPELMQAMQHEQQSQGGQQQNTMPNQQMQQQGQSYIPSLMQQQPPQQLQNGLPDPQQLLLDSIKASLKPKQHQYAPSNIGKLQNELREAQAGHYPGTDIPFPDQQTKDDFIAPYLEKLGSLKQGEHYIYDPESHEKIGVKRPFTAKERAEEEGNIFFNRVYPLVNNGIKDFVGKDSIKKFNKYANEYGRNPEATRKIDDLMLAQKLISSGVVKEAATLGAGRTNQTFNKLEKTFPQSDIPKLIDQYQKQFKLPSDAFTKSGVRFNQAIKDIREYANNAVPAEKKVYYRPERHLKGHEDKEGKSTNSEKSSAKRREPYTDKEIRATAEKYHISEEEVKKRLKEASKND